MTNWVLLPQTKNSPKFGKCQTLFIYGKLLLVIDKVREIKRNSKTWVLDLYYCFGQNDTIYYQKNGKCGFSYLDLYYFLEIQSHRSLAEI